VTTLVVVAGDGRDSALRRAHELNELGRYEQALQVLAPADPTVPEVHCERALALYRLARHADAYEAATTAVRLAPDNDWPHRLCAIALLALRRPAEALRCAETAARLAPAEHRTLMVLAETQAATRQLDAAYATAHELVRLAPSLGISHRVMGQVAAARGDWRLVELANREALARDPMDHVAMNNLAAALQRRGLRREALELYQEAARIDPTFQVARENIVRAVQPATGRSCLWSAVLAAVFPLAIPAIAVRYALRLASSRRLRGALRPGAQLYYDRVVREQAAVRWEAVALAGALFVAGEVGLILLQARGWSAAGTGVAFVVLLVACGAIAAAPTAVWLFRRVRPARRAR
jgi:tetratricopeptide (TPR) repeat protein